MSFDVILEKTCGNFTKHRVVYPVFIIGEMIGEHIMFVGLYSLYWFGAHNITMIQGTYPLLVGGLEQFFIGPYWEKSY